MPNDLLRYLAGPTGFSWWWWVPVALLVLVVAGWYAAVFVWTLPPATLRANRFLASMHRRVVVEQFSRSVRATTAAYQSGALSARAACDRYAHTLRSFLYVSTGQRAQYMQTPDLAAGALAPAAPLAAGLDELRFGGGAAAVNIAAVGQSVEEVIRTWT
jgi:hypothetical protein